jgi:hypothetical protein
MFPTDIPTETIRATGVLRFGVAVRSEYVPMSNRVQISLDSLRSYVDAVEQAFGADVDYGQIVKFYDAEPIGPGRYGR